MSQQPAPASEANSNEQITALAQTPELKGKQVSLEVGTKGFNLNTLDEAWRFCTAMAASGLMPKGMETAQKVLYALQLGFEVGLPPLAAIQSIAVINGRASLYGDVVLGIVINSGKLDLDAFEEDWIRDASGAVTGAYCIVRRLPNGRPKRWDFTIDDAMQAKLWKKEGPWTTAPKRMMQMRARSFALRDVFPDILRGIVTVEEARDLPPEPEKNVTPKRPTTLDELTNELTTETATATTEMPTQEGSASSDLAAGETGAGAGESAPAQTETVDDPMAAIRKQLEECRTVPDVTRFRNSFTGPASKLSDEEKRNINALCESRAAAIREERKASNSGQSTLLS